MGNNCVVSKPSRDNCFSGITQTFRSQPPDVIHYFTNELFSINQAASAATEPNAPSPILSKPPEKVLIVKEEQPVHSILLDPLVIVKEKTKPLQPIREEPAKPRRPRNFKMPCAGLQADSLLRTKAGHLKEHYNLGRKLGDGQYGTTFVCVERATGKEYACKSIPKRRLATEREVEDVRREIEIMHHVSGVPNVISIKGAYEDAVAVHVVMELCTGGELFDRILKRGHYSERKAAKLARTVVGVIKDLHSLGVMHRDLKPENFLFVNEQEDSAVRTIDFGLSVFFKPGEIFTDMVGSPFYVAPEVLGQRYGPEADVWSAGVIVYILLCGVPPFWAETELDIFEKVLHGDIDFTLNPWPNISQSAQDLVKKMLVRDPRKRLTADEVLRHPWIQDGVAPDKPLDPAVLRRLTQVSSMNKLEKMALRVIAGCSSEGEITSLKEMFKAIDTDASGQTTFEELKAGLKRYGANLNESEIYELMQAADLDNEDYREFIAATLYLTDIQRVDHLFAAFSDFDKDGSGYITQDELQQACKEFGIEDFSFEETIQIDQNNEGSIYYSEFVAMMQRGNAAPGAKRFSERRF